MNNAITYHIIAVGFYLVVQGIALLASTRNNKKEFDPAKSITSNDLLSIVMVLSLIGFTIITGLCVYGALNPK